MTQTPEERARLIAPYTELSRQRRDELTKQIAAAIRAAVAAETERCALLAVKAECCALECQDIGFVTGARKAAQSIARAIREAPPPQETQT